MPSETLKNQLRKIAILGTAKRSFSEQDRLSLAEWNIAAEEPEAALLSATLLIAKMEQAGFEAPELGISSENYLEEAPEEQLRRLPVAAESKLKAMLGGHYEELLPEFLHAIAKRKLRLSFPYLPDLMTWGESQSGDLTSILQELIGERGHWLLQFNPAWTYLRRGQAQGDWDLGNFEERKAILKNLREHDPRKAIEILESTWEQEEHRHRAAFIEILSINLDAADQDFLEQARLDSRSEVREAAFPLLARLPGSPFSKQLCDWLGTKISFKAGRGAKGKGQKSPVRIEMKLPGTFNAELKELGVKENMTLVEGGKKANWMAQVLRWIPLEFWEERYSLEPDSLSASLDKSDWGSLMYPSLLDAAAMFRNQKWLAALFPSALQSEHGQLYRAVDALSTETYNELLSMALKSGPSALRTEGLLLFLLRKGSAAINPANAQTLIQLYKTIVSLQGAQYDYAFLSARQSLQNLGKRIDPGLADLLSTQWPYDAPGWNHWEEAVNEFRAIMVFRKEMLGSLHS